MLDVVVDVLVGDVVGVVLVCDEVEEEVVVLEDEVVVDEEVVVLDREVDTGAVELDWTVVPDAADAMKMGSASS